MGPKPFKALVDISNPRSLAFISPTDEGARVEVVRQKKAIVGATAIVEAEGKVRQRNATVRREGRVVDAPPQRVFVGGGVGRGGVFAISHLVIFGLILSVVSFSRKVVAFLLLLLLLLIIVMLVMSM